MSYQIIIKNNDTGDIVSNNEIVGICGAIQKTDGSTVQILLSNCDLFEMSALITGASRCLTMAKLKAPEAAMLVEMARKGKAFEDEHTVES